MANKTIDKWHRVVDDGDQALLRDLLAEDVIFHSPVVHTPQRGKALSMMYLSGALQILKNESFRYVREIVGDREAVLEFTTEIDGIVINGIDLIKWNDEDKIVDFKVMVRPLKAINLLHQKMAAALEQINARPA